MTKPRLDQGVDYERGFVDGMQHQMQSSVDKAVNRMAQPEQDFVAWEQFYPDIGKPQLTYPPQGIYYTPPQRKPLTDEEIDRLWSQSLADTEGETYLPLREFARAIEAKLKEKNNG